MRMDVDIAKRLADRRRAAGFTQEELAEKLGVSRQAVSKWECSESSPDTDNLISLARLYDVSLDDLLYTDVERDGVDAAGGQGVGEEGGAEEPDAADRADTHADDGVDDGHAPGDDPATIDDDAESREGDGTTHIGLDGIHVEDGKDYVHINWRDGVNVIDGKKGDHVHVGWDGIHINDREFDNLADANAYMGTGKKGSSFLRTWNRFPFPLVVLIAYILVGLVYEAWGYGLFLIAAIPVYYALGGLFGAKRIAAFFCTLYVVGAICWFCYMAFVCNQPHPAWVVFLTIPLVGWLCGALSHWWRKRRK